MELKLYTDKLRCEVLLTEKEIKELLKDTTHILNAYHQGMSIEIILLNKGD